MKQQRRPVNALVGMVAFALAGGCAWPSVIPEIYHGRAGQTVLAVPSRIAFSVLYDGESDWTPPNKPRAERTDSDPIQSIEFYVDLDHSNGVITDLAARVRIIQRGTLDRPAVFGHVLAITADFSSSEQLTAATIRSRYSTGSVYPAPAFRALQPVPPEYGLETRRADWSKPVKDRKLHGSDIFDVDVDYLSTEENTYIFCNDGRTIVAPFLPMPTCQFVMVVPELNGHISGSIDRGDVSRWRNLRSAALATLHSFIVPR